MREKGKRKGKTNKAGISKAYQDAQDPCSPYRLGNALKTVYFIQVNGTDQPHEPYISCHSYCRPTRSKVAYPGHGKEFVYSSRFRFHQ
jgi:hypothetical protein